ncbi:hypothetical protein QJS04_geneDACA013054 [Acorus gramineus]|uniref:PHP n=1 Tax=Acorus gramineus TaxID=55184 RepID=A0AAV9B221_ACOGR|nr:hypothetical protein QJS04_geneDACA013054 [Acorus gramineus]
MDPLSALRDFTVRGELSKVTRIANSDEIRFGSDYTFPAMAETAFRSKQGNLYTLETLLYFIQNHHLKHTDYLQSSRLHRLPSVTLPDRRPLLDYLHGRTSTSDSIELPNPDLPQPPLPPPEEPQTKKIRVLEIRSLERPLKDREALLESKNRDFYGVLIASTKREEERQRMEVKGGGGGGGAKEEKPKAKILSFKGSKIGGGEGVPIILVPSAFQTLITIYNVKEFLEDGVFVPTEAKVKQGGGQRPEVVTVQKKLSRDNRAVAAYEVRDKPSALRADDWDRVVAVFVLGKEWQFKDWPFKDHVEIFNKIIGFFVRFEDDSVESAKIVKQWNISKNKRHQDRAAALEVWDRLEEFVRSRSHA